MRVLLKHLLVLLPLAFASFQANAENGGKSLGLHGNIVGGSGKPSNDVLGLGLIGRYGLNNSWFVEMEVTQSDADFERPWRVLGLQQDSSVKTVDALYKSTVAMAHIGQTFRSSARYDWYWTAGLGFNSVDVKNAVGPIAGGGTFNIRTDAGTETLLGLKIGVRQRLSDSWILNYALRATYHIADWTVTDTVTGATARIGNYGIYGLLVGVERKF